MTLKQFAALLDGREYGSEITPEEEKLAKELGYVVVFGYSDDNAELRGAIDDEIGCYDGGVLEHDDLPAPIYADWCPEDIECSWAYGTSMPHENFYIYEDGELYCVGIVCDINLEDRTSDLVEVVRCKDCAHAVSLMSHPSAAKRFEGALNCTLCRGDDGYGIYGVSLIYPDDYCSDGVRREENAAD